MKNPSGITVSGKNFILNFADCGESVFTLNSGGKTVASLGRIQCAAFSEGGGLVRKFRRHDSTDRLSADVESIVHIPFGCEYEVARDVEVTDGFAVISTDIRSLSGGKVGDIALETVCFPIENVDFKYLVYGENTWHENMDYCGSEPVIFLKCTCTDGSQVEFYSGDDLWRHRAARHIPGTEGIFSIVRSEQGITLERRVLKYTGDTEAEKRPWRFSGLLSWRTMDMKNAISDNIESFSLPGCFRSASSRREFRSAVRRTAKYLHLENINPGICMESAHLERSGNKPGEHGDLLEYARAWLWANRQLMRRNCGLYMSGKNGNLWADSVAVSNLAVLPEPLT